MTPMVSEKIERYCSTHSSPASALGNELEQHTHKHCDSPQMLTGPWEAALLRVLVGIARARRVLEIGTFTGYSALNMATALPDDGELISCEMDPKNAATAKSFFERSEHAGKITIRLGPALETLKTLTPPFDLIFIDADKENYGNYFDACVPLLRPQGLIVADNVLWGGAVLAPKETSDRAIVAFNDKVRADARVECVMLPIRDGVTLIVKK